MPSAKNVEFMLEFCMLFRPIESATREASWQKFVTSSIVIPLVRMMKKKIIEVQCKSELAVQLKTNVLAQFKKGFGAIEQYPLCAMSTLLDPRFKNLHFEDKVALSKAIRRLSIELKEETIESSESESGAQTPPYEGKQTTFIICRFSLFCPLAFIHNYLLLQNKNSVYGKTIKN